MSYSLTMSDPKSPGGRRQDSQYKQLNLLLKPELIKKLRIKAVEDDKNISELAEMIFDAWFNNND